MKSLVALILALSLASCQFPGTFGGGGSLKIQLPGPSNGRALTPSGDTIADSRVRIQLVRNGIIVPLSGSDYLEQSLAGQTVTLDGLPTGKGFQLFVSTGQHPSGGGTYFETAHYQASGIFEISAGNATSVGVTLGATRVKIVEDEANADHATTFDGDYLYVIKGPNVHKMLSGDPSILPSSPEVSSYASGYSGLKVNSLGTSTSGTLLFNTNQGILSYNGETLGTYSNITPTPVVLTSAFIPVGENVFGGFQGPGLAAGFSVGGTAWTLFPVGFFGFGGTPDYMYLATGLRTVRLTQSFLQTLFGSTDPAQKFMDAIKSGVDEVDALGESLTVSTSDGAQIGPLSVASDLSYSAYLFAGTKKGLYVGAVDPLSGTPFGTLGLVSSTSGQTIAGLTTFPAGAYSGTVSYTAALSSTTREILLFANLDLIDRVRSLEGLPSGDLQMQWYLDQTASLLYLLVSGSDATVAIPVAALPSGK